MYNFYLALLYYFYYLVLIVFFHVISVVIFAANFVVNILAREIKMINSFLANIDCFIQILRARASYKCQNTSLAVSTRAVM